MDTDNSLVDQRLVLLRRHWKNLAMGAPPAAPRREKNDRFLTIAISREVGSLGSAVAIELGKRLNWPVYDREILELIAQRSVLRTELMTSIDEQTSNWFNDTLRSIGHPEEMSRAGYLLHLKKVLTALAAHGKCILVGRGAAAMLPAASTLKLRVIAPLELRVDRMAQLMKVSRAEAKAFVHRMDDKRRQFVHSHFHGDVDDPHGFDLVLNSEHFSAKELAEMAWVALRARQFGCAPAEATDAVGSERG